MKRLYWRWTSRGCYKKTITICRDVRRTLWPYGFDLSKPKVDLPTEETVAAVFSGSQLVDETPL